MTRPIGKASLTEPRAPTLASATRQTRHTYPNTVVVLNTGAGVLMPWLGHVKGVLEMWFPGQEGGTATADLLLGKANPSGKCRSPSPPTARPHRSPGTPERTIGVNGQIVWSEGLQVGYRWYLANHVKPLFPFGFGLSYSSFEYSDLRISGPHGPPGRVDVLFRVRNTGSVSGTEIPQLYLSLPAAAGGPSQRLVGFDRVTLKAGQSTMVRLVIDPASTERPMSFWNTATHNWQIPTGSFGIAVGGSVTDNRLTGSFLVS